MPNRLRQETDKPRAALDEPPQATSMTGVTGRPPNWDRIPFAVHCDRCGTELNGTTSPDCPGCAHTVDFSTLLPLDRIRCQRCDYQLRGLTTPRCPECGLTFEWSDALEAARSRGNRLFEHFWFDDPLRAFARTFFQAVCRPRKLWSSYSVQDRPRIGPLLFLVGLQWLLFASGWFVVARAAEPFMNYLASALGRQLTFIYPFRPDFRFLPTMAFWYAGTYVTMLLFVRTNRQFDVRPADLLRILANTTIFASMSMALWCLLEMELDLGLILVPRVTRISNDTYDRLRQAVLYATLGLTWLYISIAYRQYLGIRRGWGISAMALALGYLLARLVMIYW